MNTLLTSFREIYARLNQYFVSTRLRLFMLAFGAFIVSAIILSSYAWYHIHHPAQYYDIDTETWKNFAYDIDGWGHLIPKMMENGTTWELLPQATHPYRIFLVPFLFGLSYCLLGIPESVQILNILAQSLSSVLLIYFLASYNKTPLLGMGIGIIWASWPPFSSYYGYYFSEPVYGLVVVILWCCIVLFLQTPGKAKAILIGSFLAIALHVKMTSALVVAGFFLCAITVWRRRAGKLLPIIMVTCLLAYLPWPAYNLIKHNRLASAYKTEDNGSDTWELLFGMMYPPIDDLETLQREKLPEYLAIQEKAERLDTENRNKYYQSLILEQLASHPLDVLSLVVKRFMRFWYHIPPFRFVPTPKTFLVMTPLLLLAGIGAFRRYDDVNVQTAMLLVGGMWIFHGLIHAEFRYQFPVFPTLLFLAFTGIATIVMPPDQGKKETPFSVPYD